MLRRQPGMGSWQQMLPAHSLRPEHSMAVTTERMTGLALQGTVGCCSCCLSPQERLFLVQVQPHRVPKNRRCRSHPAPTRPHCWSHRGPTRRRRLLPG
ncbi:hypothetical protein MAE02_09660 [Microvirga aerophila]|uniref:Uncharacterized protein n=1 Tax=Microvirga aerophila TaxID=670291 RepID=A0A512BMT2_9HYPH|nr:hypothetical protein MAE02_09660 [Microvirga aerophila]